MKWSPKKNFEYLCTGSGTNENFSVLTGTNVVQTIGIFDILKCGGGGATEMDLGFLCIKKKPLSLAILGPNHGDTFIMVNFESSR